MMCGAMPLCAILAATWLLSAAAVASAQAPNIISPEDGATFRMGIPHFNWEGGPPPAAGEMTAYEIQIATDNGFQCIVDEDRIAGVIRWYVPDRELGPGDYRWRLRRIDAGGRRGAWSEPRRFSAIIPERTFKVPAGAGWSDIRRIFAEAAGNCPARVVFEKAEYRLDPGEDRVFAAFSSANDLTLDGSGSSIVFTRPVGLLHLENCRRVMVKDFAFDFDPPCYTAGRVAAVDGEAGTIEAEILAGHLLPDADPAFTRDKKGMIVTEADNFAMKRGVQLVIAHDGFERVADRRYRFRFERAKTASAFSLNDIYVLDPRWYEAGGGHGAAVFGGEDVIFYNLVILGAANECLGSFYADRHAILGVQLKRGPGRALGVNNGGNNHHNARTGPWIERCLFENCGDDVCHVNGYAMGIAAHPKEDQLVVDLRQPFDQFSVGARLDMRPGDRLQFFCRRTGSLLGEANAAAVMPGSRSVEIRLDRAVPGITPGGLIPARGVDHPASGDTQVTEVYNASRMCNQFVFRNNIGRCGRRIGVLAKGNGGLIEGNTFEGLGGGGVEFWNAPFEGLAAENYVVRNNRIIECGRIDRKHAAVWATIFKSGGNRLHRNLLIEGNEIRDFPYPAISLADVAGAMVRGNRITSKGPAKGSSKPVVLQNVEAVTLK